MATRFVERIIYNLKRIDRFIRKFNHMLHLAIVGNCANKENQKKFKKLIVYLVNLLFTGFVIHYALTNFNPLSLGMISALFMFYFDWIVKTIRGKQK